jgi:excisionase family DNA binding protein
VDRATLLDVLTLEEASAYLRLPVEAVLRQALQGNIPGRKIEDNWRFLKTAIDDWLRSEVAELFFFSRQVPWQMMTPSQN